MKKILAVTGLIGAFSLMALTGAFAKTDGKFLAGEAEPKAVVENQLQDINGKSSDWYRGMWKAVKDTKVGKEMFKAMEKQDIETMRELMNDPAAVSEMMDLMNDPEVQQYHDEMHQDPAVQQLHQQMHSGTGGMGGMMGF